MLCEFKRTSGGAMIGDRFSVCNAEIAHNGNADGGKYTAFSTPGCRYPRLTWMEGKTAKPETPKSNDCPEVLTLFEYLTYPSSMRNANQSLANNGRPNRAHGASGVVEGL